MNLKLCNKQYDLLPLIVAPQPSSGWQHNYSTKTRQVGCANEQSTYSLMSMVHSQNLIQMVISLLLEHWQSQKNLRIILNILAKNLTNLYLSILRKFCEYIPLTLNVWNSTFFTNSFIIEGATLKVLQFILSVKSIYIKKHVGFIKQKIGFLLEHHRKVETRKSSLK